MGKLFSVPYFPNDCKARQRKKSNLPHSKFIDRIPRKPMPNNNELIAIPAFERNRTHFGHISNHGLQIEGNLHKEAIDFWAHIEQRAFDP